MIMLTADAGLALADAVAVELHVAGAESNAACGLAHLGHDVEWFGRLGSDPFGSRILDHMDERGVATPHAIIADGPPTGIYFKDHLGRHSEVYYYRAGSAASAMSRLDLEALSVSDRQLIHLSGITAAISATCDDLLEALLIERAAGRTTISFDVNYRPRLWDVPSAAPRLLALARAADIVVVGRDEADVLWSTGSAEGVRDLLPHVPQLVVKDAEIGATHFDETGSTFVPALRVAVVEPVGAGDAFAAGLLSGLLRGWDAARSLRLGHLMAGFTLQHVSDLPRLPDSAVILSMTEATIDEWMQLQLPPLGDLAAI